jgi:hypothetical protein
MEWFTSGVFLFIAMTSLILVIIGSYIRIKFPTIIPKEEKGEFMPISASAPIVTEMASKTTIESKKEISSEKKLENENNSPNQQG